MVDLRHEVRSLERWTSTGAMKKKITRSSGTAGTAELMENLRPQLSGISPAGMKTDRIDAECKISNYIINYRISPLPESDTIFLTLIKRFRCGKWFQAHCIEEVLMPWIL